MTSDLRNSGSRASASVSYKLSALVVRGTATIASTSQEIFIYDSLPTTPPICIGDFYPEYVCEQITSLRKRVFTKQGKLSISIDEPAPFELQHDRDLVQTKLPLSLLVRLRHGSQDEMPNFELISDITWRLKASTFVMMKESAALPTTKQASASPFVATCAVFETSQRMESAMVSVAGNVIAHRSEPTSIEYETRPLAFDTGPMSATTHFLHELPRAEIQHLAVHAH